MREILETAAADRSAQTGSNQRKMGDLYASCMDTGAIDLRGITPLHPDFEQIAAIRSIDRLSKVLARFQRMPVPNYNLATGSVVGPFRLSARQDSKNPSRVIGQVGPGANDK